MKKLYILCLGLLFTQLSFSQNITRANFAGPYGVQVNTFTGNLYLDRTDLFIPNQGLSIDLTFSYNSYRDTVNLGFGKGWTFTYSMCYYSDSTGIVVEMPDGRMDLHTRSEDTFLSPKGIFDQLEEYESGKYRLTTKYGMQYFFDDPGHRKLTRILDPNGNTIQIDYSGDKPVLITDPSGRQVTLNWEGELLTGIVDDNFNPGRLIQYAYDGYGHLSSVINPLGDRVTYNHNSTDQLTVIGDENGNTLNIEYVSGGAVQNLISCFSNIKFNYNTEQRKTYVIEANESGDQITTYDYNEEGQLLAQKGNCCGFSTSFAYDSDNNTNQLVDANGFSFVSNHDEKGNSILLTDPLGSKQQYQFTGELNRTASFQDKRGNNTDFTYDANGNLTQIDQPEGVQVSMQYDGTGNITQLKDGAGNSTGMVYNNRNDLTQINFPIGSETFTYDAVGNLLSSTDANQNAISYKYDALNQLQQITDPLGNSVDFQYDGASNLIQEKDPNGNVRNFDYDGHNRLVSVTTPSGTTQYTYDALDNLTGITDANGKITNFSYDSRNLLVEEKDAMGFTTSYVYDGNGNVISKTDANGRTISYQYDALNRLVSKGYFGNTDNYEYDPAGNLIRCSNQHISMRFTYDGLNRLTSKTVENWNKTISYTYDANGNRKTMTDPDGGLTTYEYDANDRLISLTNPDKLQTLFNYDLAGRLLRQDNSNGTYTIYTYDTADRVLSIEHHKSNGDIFSSFAYTYDNNGNRLTMTDQDGGVNRYTYDGDNRLTKVEYANGDVEEYTFDGKGNRLSLKKNDELIEYTYDAADRIQSAGNTTYKFDGNGNMIERNEDGEVTNYFYDGENHLIKILLPNQEEVSFQYDPLGDRIKKNKFYNWNNPIFSRRG